MARPLDNQTPRLHCQGPDPAEARGEILFLHGAWHGPWCWQDWAGRLAEKGYHTCRLELPGHGDEPWDLPAVTSLADYGRVVIKAVAQMGRPILVGHSMGGWLVQKILETYDLPAVLVAPLPGSGLSLARAVRFLAQHLGAAAPVLAGKPFAVPDMAAARRLFYHQLDQARLQETFQRLVPEPARAFWDMGLGLVRARPAPGRQPRLLLAAGRDYFFPPAQMQALARRLGAEFRLLPEHPHNLFIEDPDQEAWTALQGFLDALSFTAMNSEGPMPA